MCAVFIAWCSPEVHRIVMYLSAEVEMNADYSLVRILSCRVCIVEYVIQFASINHVFDSTSCNNSLNNQITGRCYMPMSKQFLRDQFAQFNREQSVGAPLPCENELMQSFRLLFTEFEQSTISVVGSEITNTQQCSLAFLMFWGPERVGESGHRIQYNSATERLLLAIRQKLWGEGYGLMAQVADCLYEKNDWLRDSVSQADYTGGFESFAYKSSAYKVLLILQCLQQVDLLAGDRGQINSEVITQGGGQRILDSADALVILQSVGILTQANFERITQNGGEYAGEILFALRGLQQFGLFTRWVAQANFLAITRGGGQYAFNIAAALTCLKNERLLEGDVIQVNVEAITQDGGRYAVEIANALGRAHKVGLLADVWRQGTVEIITQGGGRDAKNNVNILLLLQRAGFLSADEMSLAGLRVEPVVVAVRSLRQANLLMDGAAPEQITLLIQRLQVTQRLVGEISFVAGVLDRLSRDCQLTDAVYCMLVTGHLYWEKYQQVTGRMSRKRKRALWDNEINAFSQIASVLGIEWARLEIEDILRAKDVGQVVHEIMMLHSLLSRYVDQLSVAACHLLNIIMPQHLNYLGMVNGVLSRLCSEVEMMAREAIGQQLADVVTCLLDDSESVDKNSAYFMPFLSSDASDQAAISTLRMQLQHDADLCRSGQGSALDFKEPLSIGVSHSTLFSVPLLEEAGQHAEEQAEGRVLS
jgi:hypothetical protein